MPLPSPWSKTAFEQTFRKLERRRRALQAQGASEVTLEALRMERREAFTRILGNEEYAGEVGAFEGAMYAAKGLYRPCVDCVMFTMDEVDFCPVCRRAIKRIINLYTR